MRDPESLAKEKYLSTVCDVVEMSSKTWKETNMRPPESLAMQKYLSTVCDVAEISCKALKKTIVRVLEFLSQETSLRSRRHKQKSPFSLKVTSCLSRINIWDVKEISLLIFLSYGYGRTKGCYCHIDAIFWFKTSETNHLKMYIHALSLNPP